MKKIYAFVVCLVLALAGSAQTYYWVGVSGADWRNASNWSPNTGYPQLATDNAVFNNGSTIQVNLDAPIDLNTLTVTGNSTIKITGTGSTDTITLHSTNAASPGLKIDAGSSLEEDAVLGSGLTLLFLDNGQGSVSGTWILSGDAYNNVLVNFLLPESEVPASLIINGGGRIVVGPKGYLESNSYSHPDDYFVFKPGSTLELQTIYPYIPQADYSATSSIIVNGATENGIAIEEGNQGDGAIGNFIYNCPGQSVEQRLALLDMNIQGDLTILNTNGKDLFLLANNEDIGPHTPILNNVNIGGNFSISGNSKVTESEVTDLTQVMTLTVQGDFISSASFNMQTINNNGIQPTSLILKGNFIQTAGGSFDASSTAVDETRNLFNVEFSGTSAQTISSSTGSIDNANHQVTLKINNPQGVTLNSPLETGRIDFGGSTPGKINTSTANYLTINNTSGNNIVVNSPSNAGFVNGPVRRKTLSSSPVSFPSGTGNILRSLTLTPANASANTFQVNLHDGNNGGATLAPVAGMANYYWDVTQTSGSSAATITMDLVDQVASASATDSLVPVAYDLVSGNWLDARRGTGTYIFPGTSTTGTLTTASQSAFTSYGIGYVINSTLAIKLISFTGRKVQNAAELAWTITDNSTPAKFEVVRSVDGTTFTSIGSIPGIAGKLDYGFTDNLIVAGNNFYRLKMYDRDGTVSYSNIIVVTNGSKGVVINSMIPTVVTGRARLNINSSVRGSMQLVVTDISGRIVRSQIASLDSGNQDVWLDASSLSTGMFQITGYINGEKTATIRFIKQ